VSGANLNVQNISAGFSFIEMSNGARIQLNQILETPFENGLKSGTRMASFTETEALWLAKKAGQNSDKFPHVNLWDMTKELKDDIDPKHNKK